MVPLRTLLRGAGPAPSSEEAVGEESPAFLREVIHPDRLQQKPYGRALGGLVGLMLRRGVKAQTLSPLCRPLTCW